MPSQRNIQQLFELKDKVARAKSIVFADYSGLNVAEQSDLRNKTSAVGGELTVAKNTLLKLALQERMTNVELKMMNDNSAFKIHNSEFLQGPTAVLFSYQDEILPLKILVEFGKNRDKPKVKGGMLGDKSLTVDEILELAELPSKPELLVRLMRQIQGPMYGLVRVLEGNIQKLVYVLDAIGRSKHESIKAN